MHSWQIFIQAEPPQAWLQTSSSASANRRCFHRPNQQQSNTVLYKINLLESPRWLWRHKLETKKSPYTEHSKPTFFWRAMCPMVSASWSQSIDLVEEFSLFALFVTADLGFKGDHRAAEPAWYKPQGLTQDFTCSLSLCWFFKPTLSSNSRSRRETILGQAKGPSWLRQWTNAEVYGQLQEQVSCMWYFLQLPFAAQVTPEVF